MLIFYAYVLVALENFYAKYDAQHQCDADETVISSRCLIRISGQSIAGSPVFRKAPFYPRRKKNQEEKKTIGTHRGGQLTNETGKHRVGRRGKAGDDLRGPSFPHSNVPTMAINNKPAGGSPGMII